MILVISVQKMNEICGFWCALNGVPSLCTLSHTIHANLQNPRAGCYTEIARIVQQLTVFQFRNLVKGSVNALCCKNVSQTLNELRSSSLLESHLFLPSSPADNSKKSESL